MATGTVKWFNNAKGYGFISPEGGGSDVFAHFSAIIMEGYKTLKQGQKVEFDLIDGPRGLQATKIQMASGEAISNTTEAADATIQ
ncbi:MAG: cold-shock protein [Gammaproteobacteria bacterium]|nr:cold-shock protein [Gammaproteobacteria bacterium]